MFTYSITAGPLVGSSGTVDVVDGDVFRLSGYTGYNNSFGNGLYVAVNNFSLTKSQTQSVINAELQSHFNTDFEYYLGDGSTGADGADGVGGVRDFVARGTLPNGTPVILNSDGTVSAVREIVATESIPAGSATLFGTGLAYSTSVDFDPNSSNKFVMVYSDADNSFYGTAVIGTVSGTSISFSSTYIFATSTSFNMKLLFDPNTPNKFIIIYRNPSNYGTCVVGTVSGSSLSFGTPVVFNTAATYYPSVSFDPNTAGKFVVTYRDDGNSYYGTAIVGQFSGTTPSFGAEAVFKSTQVDWSTVAFHPQEANKLIIAARVFQSGSYGFALVASISGNSLTFSSEYVIDTADTQNLTLAIDPNSAGRFVVAYGDAGNSNYGTLMGGSFSGNIISLGNPVVYLTHSATQASIAFDPNTAGRFAIFYKDGTNPYWSGMKVGTLSSGNVLSLGSANAVTATGTSEDMLAFNPHTSGQLILSFRDSNSRSNSIVAQLSATDINLVATNFVGISTAAYADAATASIVLAGGVSSNQTGLTTNSTYYVQTDGTLAASAGTPSVEAGRALSATSLLLTSEAGADGSDGSDGAQGVQGIQGTAGLGI